MERMGTKMFFKTLLGKLSTTTAANGGGLEPWEDGYSIASSTPNGRFAMFVLDDTWKLLSEEGGLTTHDLRELPERVHGACERLGLLRQVPRQFFLEFGPLDHPTDAPMCITRTSPVDVAPERGPGETIERAIIIFPESYRQELAVRSAEARRLYTRIALAHEMAHLFVTDEFHGPFNGMGYARLERLTDAIAFHIFEQELQDTAAGDRVPFVKSFPYITGFIRAALNPTIDDENLVQLAQVVAAEMVREGQKFKGPARPSDTGIALGAPSLE
jgi:hypothetical protein